jgi:hypothetical protein
MACIPPAYCKDKAVDYDREIFSILGNGYRSGCFHFAPPSLGVWSLWEIIDSPLIKDYSTASVGDFFRLCYINHARREAVALVSQWVDDGKPGLPDGHGIGAWRSACSLDRAAIKYSRTIPRDVMTDAGQAQIIKQIDLCGSGYDMFPSNGEAPSRHYLFAGEAYGSICYHDIVNHDRLIWDVPMSLVGHVAAHSAIVNGAKGICRPKDKQDILLQFKMANERENRGELHPWQIERPLECDGTVHGLSRIQKNHPQCVAQWETLLSEAKAKKTGR